MSTLVCVSTFKRSNQHCVSIESFRDAPMLGNTMHEGILVKGSSEGEHSLELGLSKNTAEPLTSKCEHE